MEIKEIADRAGCGVVALSTRLGLSRGAVSQWDVVPPDRVLAVCAAANWKVTPHEVRPDLYPNPGDALPAQGYDFGDLGESRMVDRRLTERRNPESDFGEFGEPRDGDRRVESRRPGDKVDA